MNHIEKRLIFYWVSISLMVVLSPLTYFFEKTISESNILTMVVFAFMIPIGIGYFSLIADILKVFGLKFLILAPLIFWPRVLALVLFFFPVIYLSYRTCQYMKVSQDK